MSGYPNPNNYPQQQYGQPPMQQQYGMQQQQYGMQQQQQQYGQPPMQQPYGMQQQYGMQQPYGQPQMMQPQYGQPQRHGGMDGGGADQEFRVVYIGSISSSVDEDTLRGLFAHCGEVTKVKFGGDPNYGARFGFVEFVSNECAQKACNLNGLQLGDRAIKVSMARSPTIGGGRPGGFAARGGYGGRGGFGGGMGGGMGMGRSGRPPMVNDPEKAARTIYIAGVDPWLSETHIQHFFSNCGEVIAVRINGPMGSSPRNAWAEFTTIEGMEMALTLDGQVMGTMPVKVARSRSSIHNNGLPNAVGKPLDIKAATKEVEEKLAGGPGGGDEATKLSRSIAMGSVPSGLKEMDVLRVIIPACGPCVRIQLAPDTNNDKHQFCWLEFTSTDGANLCLGMSGKAWDVGAQSLRPADEGNTDECVLFVERSSAVLSGGVEVTPAMLDEIRDGDKADKGGDGAKEGDAAVEAGNGEDRGVPPVGADDKGGEGPSGVNAAEPEGVEASADDAAKTTTTATRKRGHEEIDVNTATGTPRKGEAKDDAAEDEGAGDEEPGAGADADADAGANAESEEAPKKRTRTRKAAQ